MKVCVRVCRGYKNHIVVTCVSTSTRHNREAASAHTSYMMDWKMSRTDTPNGCLIAVDNYTVDGRHCGYHRVNYHQSSLV